MGSFKLRRFPTFEVWRVEKDNRKDEVAFVVEKDSPADKVLQILANHGFDAEITSLEVKGSGPGRHQLVKFEGVLCDKHAGSAFTIWAIILLSGIAYLLSAQGSGETDIPPWPRLYQLLLKGELGTKDDAEKEDAP